MDHGRLRLDQCTIIRSSSSNFIILTVVIVDSIILSRNRVLFELVINLKHINLLITFILVGFK
jgi:hypothetical protein